MYEVERAANPRDAGNHMQPSDDDAQRLGEDGVHSQEPHVPGIVTMAEGAGAVQACAGSLFTGNRCA
jgi:hypothetical protein